MAPSRDAQRKHVVIGLALGVLLEGADAVTADKMKFTFAFNHTWRLWGRASQFPGIREPFPGDDIWLGLRKSGNRQMAFAAWDDSERGWWIPYLAMESLTLEDAVDIHSDERAGKAEWRTLARPFLDRLGGSGVGTFN